MYDYEADIDNNLLREINEKEDLLMKMLSKACKCPKCKNGYFRHETTDREYSFDNWFECDKCGYVANKYRDKMIRNLHIDHYYSYELHNIIDEYEYGSLDIATFETPDKKLKDFNADDFDKQSIYKMKWKDIVNNTFTRHLQDINFQINEAKNYPLLKKFFKDK